jgi:hypothetical protein
VHRVELIGIRGVAVTKNCISLSTTAPALSGIQARADSTCEMPCFLQMSDRRRHCIRHVAINFVDYPFSVVERTVWPRWDCQQNLMVGKHPSFVVLDSSVIKEKPIIHRNPNIVPVVAGTYLHPINFLQGKHKDFTVGFWVVNVNMNQRCKAVKKENW